MWFSVQALSNDGFHGVTHRMLSVQALNSGGCHAVGRGLSGRALPREARNRMATVGDKLVERISFCMAERLTEL